jgi:hypothetical protein
MPNGMSIQSRIARALGTVRASAFPVIMRKTASVSGNTLLGIGVETQFVDILIEPSPSVRRVTADEVATSGGFYQPGDYVLICPGSIPRDQWRNSLLLYGDEILQIKRVDESVIDGTVVAWTVTARSIKSGD